jgi:uncharacterized protein YlaI
MKTYKCEECGHIFEDGEEARGIESHGEGWWGCPKCKGNAQEIKPCKICGTYNHDIEEYFCDDCKKIVKAKFKKLIENFSETERELLSELFEKDCL